jgi:transmembrane sensor
VKNKSDIVINDDLISRYLCGEAQPEEAEALVDWLSITENLEYFESIEAAWNATLPSKSLSTFNKESAWKTVQHAVNIQPTKSSMSFWYRAAAVFIVAVSCSLFAYYFYQNRVTPEEITVESAGTQRTVTLPDNSSVVINRNSAISYPENFGKNSRDVNFSGEGFFSVEGNAGKPFIVHTSLGNIRVVGTRFNVSMEKGILNVDVQEGKVLVFTATDSTYLDAGYSASVEANKSINVINAVNENQWGYATRRFTFQDTPLSEVFESIEKAYPYSIEVVNNDIKNCRLTVAFDHVSAREMLNLIAETVDLTIQEYDSSFRVDGKGCPWDQ